MAFFARNLITQYFAIFSIKNGGMEDYMILADYPRMLLDYSDVNGWGRIVIH